MGVVGVTWPFLNFWAPIISLIGETGCFKFRVQIDTNAIAHIRMTDYLPTGCVQGHVTCVNCGK